VFVVAFGRRLWLSSVVRRHRITPHHETKLDKGMEERQSDSFKQLRHLNKPEEFPSLLNVKLLSEQLVGC